MCFEFIEREKERERERLRHWYRVESVVFVVVDDWHCCIYVCMKMYICMCVCIEVVVGGSLRHRVALHSRESLLAGSTQQDLSDTPDELQSRWQQCSSGNHLQCRGQSYSVGQHHLGPRHRLQTQQYCLFHRQGVWFGCDIIGQLVFISLSLLLFVYIYECVYVQKK